MKPLKMIYADKVYFTEISPLSAANKKRERRDARMRSKDVHDDEWRRRRRKGTEE